MEESEKTNKKARIWRVMIVVMKESPGVDCRLANSMVPERATMAIAIARLASGQLV